MRASFSGALNYDRLEFEHGTSSFAKVSGLISNWNVLTKSSILAGASARPEDLLLALYQQDREGFASKLEGEFAIVLWDHVNRQLVCVRDRLGVHPFFFAWTTKEFLFSSDVLDVAREVRKGPDLETLAFALVGDWHQEERSLYEGINRLPPAHILTSSREGFKQRRYWLLESKPFRRDLEVLRGELSDCFLEAVRSRLDVKKTGVFLSGGFDSAAIAYAASAAGNIESFSLRFSDPKIDDREALDRILEQCPWPSHTVDPETCLSEVNWDPRVELSDVTYDPCLSAFRPMLRLAQERGLTTVLSGAGGDDVFTPSSSAADLLRSGRLTSAWSDLNTLATGHPLRDLLYLGVTPLIPPRMRVALGRFKVSKPFHWMTAAVLTRYNVQHRIRAAYDRKIQFFESPMLQNHYLRLFLSGNNSRAFEEEQKLASLYGIRFSYPFFDHKLMSLAFQIPAGAILAEGHTKYFLRTSLKATVPEFMVLRRNNQDFTPFSEAVVHRQRQTIGRLFDKSRLCSMGLVREDYLLDLKQKPKWLASDLDMALRFNYFENWLRSFDE